MIIINEGHTFFRRDNVNYCGKMKERERKKVSLFDAKMSIKLHLKYFSH